MTAREYAEGYAFGVEIAEYDLANSYPSLADELREEAREAREVDSSRSWAAFKLGLVRGYRSIVRTQLGGRWGT